MTAASSRPGRADQVEHDDVRVHCGPGRRRRGRHGSGGPRTPHAPGSFADHRRHLDLVLHDQGPDGSRCRRPAAPVADRVGGSLSAGTAIVAATGRRCRTRGSGRAHLQRTFTEPRPRGRRVTEQARLIDFLREVRTMMWGNGMGWGGWLLMTADDGGLLGPGRLRDRGPVPRDQRFRPRDRDPERGARQILDEAVRPRRDRRRGVQLAAEPAAPTALMAPRGRAPSDDASGNQATARVRLPGTDNARQHSPTDPAAVRASPFRIPPRKQ